jgi:hypothetical protein
VEAAPVQAAAPARRSLTPFARKHSVLAAAAVAQPAAKLGAPSASLVAEVQEVVAGTLGVRAAPTQPLMEAGMDSLGERACRLVYQLKAAAWMAQRSNA